MKDFFCPNCGTKLKAGTKFCSNCGANVSNVQSKSDSVSSRLESNNSNKNSVKESASANFDSFVKKWDQNKKRNYSILGIVVAIIIFLVWGHFYYTVDNQLNRATTAIGDPSKNAAKYVTSTSSEVRITNKTVKPIQKYFQKYPGDLSTMKQDFQVGNKWSSYQFVQKGRAWLIWPRYKIQAEPTYFTINTDQKGMNIKMDGETLGKVTSNTNTSDNSTSDVNQTTSSTAYSRSFGPYLPGLHTFVGTKNIGKHQIKATVTSSDTNITMNNGISNDTAQSILSNVFQSNVDDQDESFVNGQNNTDYKQLVKMFNGFNHDDDINSFQANVNVNNVTPISDKKFKVNYQVKFVFYNKNGDDGETKKIQVFKYTATLVKTNNNNSSSNGFQIQSLGHAKKVSETSEDDN